jgi:hypothetical protein
MMFCDKIRMLVEKFWTPNLGLNFLSGLKYRKIIIRYFVDIWKVLLRLGDYIRNTQFSF